MLLMIEWVYAVAIMLATMAFGWWLQRREAKWLGQLIEDGNKRVTKLIEDGNIRMERILSELHKDHMTIASALRSKRK